jgi:hypothetical protein
MPENWNLFLFFSFVYLLIGKKEGRKKQKQKYDMSVATKYPETANELVKDYGYLVTKEIKSKN